MNVSCRECEATIADEDLDVGRIGLTVGAGCPSCSATFLTVDVDALLDWPEVRAAAAGRVAVPGPTADEPPRAVYVLSVCGSPVGAASDFDDAKFHFALHKWRAVDAFRWVCEVGTVTITKVKLS